MDGKRSVTFTPSGKKRAPSKELVFQWIHKAWQEIPADLVANSVKSCGISNALDGTEDEAVWEEEGAGADEADDELKNEFDTDSEQEDWVTRQTTQQPPQRLFSEPPRFFSEPPNL